MFGLSKKKKIQKGSEAFLKGDQYLTQGDFTNALKMYREALSLLPKDAPVIENLQWSMGEANRGLEKYHIAIDHYIMAITPNNKNEFVLAYSGLANCYLQIGKYEQAKSSFEKALSINYDTFHEVATQELENKNVLFRGQVRFENHYGLAMAFNQLKQFDECLKHLEIANSIKKTPQIDQYIHQLKSRTLFSGDKIISLLKEKLKDLVVSIENEFNTKVLEFDLIDDRSSLFRQYLPVQYHVMNPKYLGYLFIPINEYDNVIQINLQDSKKDLSNRDPFNVMDAFHIQNYQSQRRSDIDVCDFVANFFGGGSINNVGALKIRDYSNYVNIIPGIEKEEDVKYRMISYVMDQNTTMI